MTERISPIYYDKEKHELVFAECTEEEARNQLKQIVSDIKLRELVKKSINENNKMIDVIKEKGIIQGDRQAQIFKLEKLNSIFRSLIEESEK